MHTKTAKGRKGRGREGERDTGMVVDKETWRLAVFFSVMDMNVDGPTEAQG